MANTLSSVSLVLMLSSCSTPASTGGGESKQFAIYSAVLSYRIAEEQKIPVAIGFIPLKNVTQLGIVGGLREEIGDLMDDFIQYPHYSTADEIHLQAAANSLRISFVATREPASTMPLKHQQPSRGDLLRISALVLNDEFTEALVFTQQGTSYSYYRICHTSRGWTVVNRRWIGNVE